MDNFVLDPRVYQREIDKKDYALYLESANSANAHEIHYQDGMFYAEFESNTDYLAFSRALQARKLPF